MTSNLVWTGSNVVYGDGTPTRVSSTIFDRLNESDWTPGQVKMVQAAWDAYQYAIDNFDHQENEYGVSDPNGLIWACGRVFGAASVLSAVSGIQEKDFGIPIGVWKVADKYSV